MITFILVHDIPTVDLIHKEWINECIEVTDRPELQHPVRGPGLSIRSFLVPLDRFTELNWRGEFN